MLYQLYGFFHKSTKRLLRRSSTAGDAVKFAYVYQDENLPLILNAANENLSLNDKEYKGNITIKDSTQLFMGENAVIGGTNLPLTKWTNLGSCESPRDAWCSMLHNTAITYGWRNAGFHLTGFLLEKQNWVLSSWIWTSAAICRCFLTIGETDNACKIADAFLREQLPDGGWIVRYDFGAKETIPMVAPNDSAYIANNALLEMYRTTGESKYLDGACKCADWIIRTAREDGMVLLGMNSATGKWQTDANIVDVGFTGGLFAHLFEITGVEKYLAFLKKFTNRYIELFWDDKDAAFYTSLNKDDIGGCGHFARGQAWAMEGLIPAWKVTKDENCKRVLDLLANTLVKQQSKNGGWAYNIAKPMMGQDCKGVALIAKNLLLWGQESDNQIVYQAALKALDWCEKHTQLSGACVGGIFSYSVEGAVVGTLISAFLGIVLAYTGAGVWALVVQQMSNMLIDTIVLWFTVKWRPKKLFSLERLKVLFSFGWKLLVSSLLETVSCLHFAGWNPCINTPRFRILGYEREASKCAPLRKGNARHNNAGGTDDDVLFNVYRCAHHIFVYVGNHWIRHALTGIIITDAVHTNTRR